MAQADNTFMRGVLSALVGAGLWGFSGSCIQYLTASCAALPPSLVTAIRMIGASLLFLCVLLATQRDTLSAIVHSRKTLAAMAVFAVGIFGSQFTYACSVQLTNAGTATVLQMLSTVFILAYVCIKGHSLPRPAEAVGLVLALVATTIIATKGDLSSLRLPLDGLIWGIVNAAAVALYVLAPKELGLFDRFGSFASAGMAMLMGMPLAVIVCAGQAAGGVDMGAALGTLDATGWLVLLVGVIALGTFGAYALYIHGVSLVGSITGGLLGAMEPVSACVCAALWLGTAFTGWDWLGLILMIGMLALTTLGGAKPATSDKTD